MLEMNFSLGVCHGDFLFKNIIRDNENLYLIDWEYFGVSLKYWDLATLWLQLMDSNEFQKVIFKRVPLIDHEAFRLTVIGILLKEIRLDNETDKKRNMERLLQIAGEFIKNEN
jgi:thiamine kinase-like enzyme